MAFCSFFLSFVRPASVGGVLDESRECLERRVQGVVVRFGPPHAACDFRLITPGIHSHDEPRCQVLPTRKDTGTRAKCVFLSLRCAQLTVASVQEFRQELQAAETKDKKFTKRKTVLKKIVANITMGNDSSYCNV